MAEDSGIDTGALLDEILGDLDFNPFSAGEAGEMEGDLPDRQVDDALRENGDGGEYDGGTEPEMQGEANVEGNSDADGGAYALPFPEEGPGQADTLRTVLMERGEQGAVAVDMSGVAGLSAESLAVLVAYSRDFTDSEGIELHGVDGELASFFDLLRIERDTNLRIAGRG
mgnify:FL=1